MFFEQQEGKTGCSQLSWLFEIPLLFTKVAPKFFGSQQGRACLSFGQFKTLLPKRIP